MTARAPKVRTVCQLTGEKSAHPSVFFSALKEADQHLTEVDALRAEVEKLRAERARVIQVAEEMAAFSASPWYAQRIYAALGIRKDQAS
ncbi:hypothetical protein QEH38_gp52 [Mycobacterium phage LilSpotty]|uniref:Helix-turn-helix DNA binding domain protein n=1 Tax=Mycobacterium phage LilSpotty TaxID=2588512 RepID=A0A4Y6EWI1_9CAUD|nr:hypothetical protein QEH38_gp52 [Mycobacterium phage LilSpotty]QDF19784.1 hypothetical protein SEA_LILSPOTTY_52 [Mycobacterium phage LilSpotty]